MQIMKALTFGLVMAFLAPGELPAQAIGEYGKTVGGVGQRQGNVNQKASRASATWEGVPFQPRWSWRQDRRHFIRGKMMRQRK